MDEKVYCDCDPGWMNVDCSINKVTYGVSSICVIAVLFVILGVAFVYLRSLSDKQQNAAMKDLFDELDM